MTKLRQAFVEILIKRNSPLSASDITEALGKKGIKVNKTSVYREIEFLISKQIIAELDLLDGKKRYEIFKMDSHHHHLVCTGCENIVCVDMPRDLDLVEKRLSSIYKFKITSHVLEFFGLCHNCQ